MAEHTISQNLIPRSEEEVTVVTHSVPNVQADITSYSNIEPPADLSPASASMLTAPQSTDGPDEMMARTRKLLSYTWTSATAFGGFTAFYPGVELYNSLATIVNPLNFIYFKYNGVKLRFTPNTTKFYRGMLGITYVPCKYAKTNPWIYTPTALSSLPTTYLDASSMESVEVAYPWTHPLPKFAPSELSDLGHVVLWVVDPLYCETAPGEVSTITINIEANFVSPRLLDPMKGGSTVPSPIARVSNSMQPGGFVGPQGPGSVAKEAEEKASRGTISKALDSTSKIAGQMSTFPVVGGFAQGLSVVTRAASGIFDFFGLSKPTNLGSAQYVINKPIHMFNTLDGLTDAEVLSADQLPFVATEPAYVGTTSDELSFEHFRERPSMIAKYSTTTMGTDVPVLLGRVAVRPDYGWKTDPNHIQSSNLGVLSNTFDLWSGDIAFKIIVPANPLIRARIAIAHSLEPMTTFSEEARYMFVDITGTTVIDGLIPHLAQAPRRSIGRYNAAGVTTTETNGYLHFFQISNVVADTPAVTPRALSILVFAAGTPNTHFSLMRSATGGRSLTSGAALPNGFLSLDDSVHLSKLTSEEEIYNYRQLLQRPMDVGDVTCVQNVGVDFNPSLHWTAQYILKLFRFMRGTVTYTIIPDEYDPAQIELPVLVSESKDDYTFCQYSWHIGHPQSLSVTLPYRHKMGYHYTGSVDSGSQVPGIHLYNRNAATIKFSVYIKFNDDLTCGVRIPPRYIVSP